MEPGLCVGLLLAPAIGASMASKHPVCCFLSTTDFQSFPETVAQTPPCTHGLKCDVPDKPEEELSKSVCAENHHIIRKHESEQSQMVSDMILLPQSHNSWQSEF